MYYVCFGIMLVLTVTMIGYIKKEIDMAREIKLIDARQKRKKLKIESAKSDGIQVIDCSRKKVRA